ncbi:hypothetical protein AB5S17_11905 [Jiella sp. M17.18]
MSMLSLTGAQPGLKMATAAACDAAVADAGTKRISNAIMARCGGVLKYVPQNSQKALRAGSPG